LVCRDAWLLPVVLLVWLFSGGSYAKKEQQMNNFPEFSRGPANLIEADKQYTCDITGYVFHGSDDTQMA
jgi:hypothetical protein